MILKLYCDIHNDNFNHTNLEKIILRMIVVEIFYQSNSLV